MGIESRQVKIADRFPHQPDQVVFGYQVFQSARYGPSLRLTLRSHNRWTGGSEGVIAEGLWVVMGMGGLPIKC